MSRRAALSPSAWALMVVPPMILLGGLAIREAWPAHPPATVAAAPVRQVKAPDDTPRTYDQALARAQDEVANAEARAAQHPGEWTILESLARRYAARARLTGSFDDYAAAQRTLDRAFAVAVPGAGPHHTQAALHFTMHRLGPAAAMLDKIDAYVVPPDIEERAEIAAMRGDIALYRGDYAGAQAAYARSEAMEPGGGGPFRAAVLAMKTGRLDEAERLFEQSIRASRMPTPQMRANIALQTGALYLERGRWDEALDRFRRADALFPGFWLIQEHIAETLALQGRTKEAEAFN